jgi:FtsH-binding integral membrane protein
MDEQVSTHVPANLADETPPSPQRPAVTFMGNTYDLVSLGALASGLLIAVTCLTCNMGWYCLPLVPIAAGIVGLSTARQAVNAERTRQWSWIGLGAGIFVLLLIGLAILAYVGLFAFGVLATNGAK